MCSCWSELLTVTDKTLVVGYMHTPCLTPHCLQSHFVIPDTVCTVMWVTVCGATWEDGGGAAAIPVVPAALERKCVCQNVLQLRCVEGVVLKEYTLFMLCQPLLNL